MENDVEELRVEAVVADYYMNRPLPANAIAKLPISPCYIRAREVPVVRIFGATPAGQKALVHVHGVGFHSFAAVFHALTTVTRRNNCICARSSPISTLEWRMTRISRTPSVYAHCYRDWRRISRPPMPLGSSNGGKTMEMLSPSSVPAESSPR
jgi:hypothetical protein